MFADSIQFFTGIQILNFTQRAIKRYQELQALKINVAKMDLRIAAITLEAGAVLISRNLRDFQRIPQLTVEDWSIDPT